jgi:hypothetical protein
MEFHSRRLRILEISHEKQRDEPPRQPGMFNTRFTLDLLALAGC